MNTNIISLNTDEFLIHLYSKGESTISITIKTTSPIRVRSLSGNQVLQEVENGEGTIETGSYNAIVNIDDTVIFGNKEAITELTITAPTVGYVSGFRNFYLPNATILKLENCFGVNVLKAINPTKIAMLKAVGSGSYGGSSKIKNANNLQYLTITDSNIAGEISNLPPNIITLSCAGSALYGNMEDFPGKSTVNTIYVSSTIVKTNLSRLYDFIKLSTLYCYGYIEGDIAGTHDMPTIKSLFINNTIEKDKIYGDIGLTPSTLNSFVCDYSSQLKYTTRKTWANDMTAINVQLSDSTQVDNLLIDLSNATWQSGGKIVIKKGKRTASSDAAYNTLTSKGVTVSFVE